MSVEVVVPEEYMGVIIGDLNSRRGRIEGIEHRAGSQVIKSLVPLAEMFATPTNMRSNTQGRATFSMHFAHYDEAPLAVTKKLSPRYRASGGKVMAGAGEYVIVWEFQVSQARNEEFCSEVRA